MVDIVAKLAVTALGIAPVAVTPGPSVAIAMTWSDIATPSGANWVGLYKAGTADSLPLAERWLNGYANSTLDGTPNTPATPQPFVIPALTPPGAYELRLFQAKDSGQRLAVSPSLNVLNAGATGQGDLELLGGSTWRPGGTIRYRIRTPTPSGAPGDTVAVVCLDNGVVVVAVQQVASLYEGTLPLPSTLGANLRYQVQYRQGNGSVAWDASDVWIWNLPSIAGHTERAWDTLRNNASYQDVYWHVSEDRPGNLLVVRPLGSPGTTTAASYIGGTGLDGAWHVPVYGWTPGAYQTWLYDGATGQCVEYGLPFTITP